MNRMSELIKETVKLVKELTLLTRYCREQLEAEARDRNEGLDISQ